MSSWFSQSRPSHLHVSTHQTLVGKALFEHAPRCATVAAVAAVSSSLLKSSLGPNLLALIEIGKDTIDLVDKIFVEHNPHMHLTQALRISFADKARTLKLLNKLKENNSLFPSSLRRMRLGPREAGLLSEFSGFSSLTSVTLDYLRTADKKATETLSTLPALTELNIITETCDSAFFKNLGDLENAKYLKSIQLLSVVNSQHGAKWGSDAFRQHFCARLLAKNRLVRLETNSEFDSKISVADAACFRQLGLTNLLVLGSPSLGWIPVSLMGVGFVNLRVLYVRDVRVDDLIKIGNNCLQLDELGIVPAASPHHAVTKIPVDDKGDDDNNNDNNTVLVDEAFRTVRKLYMASHESLFLYQKEVINALSHFVSLESFHAAGVGEFSDFIFLRLPNRGRLRELIIDNNEMDRQLEPLSDELFTFTELRRLELSNAFLTPSQVTSGLSSMKHLEELILYSYINIEADLRIDEGPMFRDLCPHFPKLRVLQTSSSRNYGVWSAEDVEFVLETCPLLEEFGYGVNRYINPWVKGLLDKYPHLMKFDAGCVTL